MARHMSSYRTQKRRNREAEDRLDKTVAMLMEKAKQAPVKDGPK